MATEPKIFTPRVIVQLIVSIFLFPLVPLIVSGRWGWWEAWVHAVIFTGGFIISRLLIHQRHPDLITERARFLQVPEAKPWDKILVPLIQVCYVLLMVVAGLEARAGLPGIFSLPLRLASIAVIITGFALGTAAMAENRFFSGMVRIQTDRGHTVVSGGPYRWVRHPGYASGLLTYFATPVLLNSKYALIPLALLSAVVIYRTALEDRTLQAELPGYAGYAQRVRWRLLPGVW